MQSLTFDNHPDAMWIYDLETLRFLEVNAAAVEKYGYSRDEFLAMTVKDIRPSEDVPALLESVRSVTPGADYAGTWRHQLRNGQIISVDIYSRVVEFAGRRAELVSIRDISQLVELQQHNQNLAENERQLRQQAQESAARFQSLFEAVPGRFLVLSPERYEIVAVSDAYLGAAAIRREDLVGRVVFDVLPKLLVDATNDSGEGLRRSLDRVVATRRVHVMPVQRYPVRPHAPSGQGLEERLLSPVNTPVIGADSAIAFIMHRIDDVTEALPSELDGEAGEGEHPLTRQSALNLMLQTLELRAANNALRDQQASLRMAQRLLGIGLWHYATAEDLLHWSDEVFDMYGVADKNLSPHFDDYVALVHPDDRKEMLAHYAAFAASTDLQFRFEHRIVRPDGVTIHVLGIGEKVTDPDGNLHITGVVRDITQEKAVEARMIESSRLQRLAGKVARFGAWRVQLEPEEVFWSAETAAIHEEPEGISPTLQRALEYYAPESREQIRIAFSTCARDGTPFDTVLQIITATGQRVWVRTIGEPDFDERGRVRAVHGAFQDVSELFDAREKAQRLSYRMQETLEEINAGFFMLDREWKFVYLNSQAERLMRRGREQLVGRKIWLEFPEAYDHNFRIQCEKAAFERVTVRFVEYYAPLLCWYEVNIYPTGDGMAVYMEDITSLRELEEQLQQAQKLEAVGQLTGGVAHDFNNLLTVIIGNAELLRLQLGEEPELCSHADMIMQAAESGAQLTSRLLAFARRQALQPRIVDINNLVGRLQDMLRRTLGENQEIEVKCAAGLWATKIDPAQLGTALLNLAINARDAMPTGGQLTIETSNTSLQGEIASKGEQIAGGDFVRLTVSDTGTGMSAEVAERAFDPFFTTKEQTKGSGLGLSMVYGFVRQSGGHARIRSEPGRGTTVELYFPRSDGEVGPEHSLESEHAAPGHERILVVEDEELVRVNLIRRLEGLGYRVSSAANGRSALELLRTEQEFDLLFTDVVMPGGMSGVELAAAAEQQRPGLKVLFTSGYARDELMHRGRLEPGFRLLNKPYSQQDLARKLREALDNSG